MRAEHCFSLEEAYTRIQMEGEDVMTTTDEKAAPGTQPVELDNPALEPITSGKEARKPLVAVLAAYASMRAGRRIDLAEFDGA